MGHYIGLGPGAGGYLQNTRYTNVADFKEYTAAIKRGEKPIGYSEELTSLDGDNELMMLNIRLNEGIDLNKKLPSGMLFKERYGDAVARNVEKGLLKICGDHILLTEKGRDLSNQVEVDFFQLNGE